MRLTRPLLIALALAISAAIIAAQLTILRALDDYRETQRLIAEGVHRG